MYVLFIDILMNVYQLYSILLQFGLVEYKMENEMNTHKSKLAITF